jgi:hypothetical protein
MDPLYVDPDSLTTDSQRFTNVGESARRIAGYVDDAGSQIRLPDDPASVALWNSFTSAMSPITQLLLGYNGTMNDMADYTQATANLFSLSNDVNTDSVPLP